MSARLLSALAPALLASACAPPIQTLAPLPPSEQVTPQQWAATCSEWDEWDKPAPPYRIHGSTYYVGTCGISAILVAGAQGHVLIDSGTVAGAQVVLDNIGKLGFRPNEIASLLHSHEHFDHVGGQAARMSSPRRAPPRSCAAARTIPATRNMACTIRWNRSQSMSWCMVAKPSAAKPPR